RFFENTHGPVPDDGLRPGNSPRIRLNGFRTDVDPDLPFADFIDHFAGSARRDLRDYNMIDRQHELASELLQQAFGKINLVFFDQGLAGRFALSFEERV